MIKYDLCIFNQMTIDKETISCEKMIIQELIKKLSLVNVQRVPRFNKTVVTKTNLGDIKIILNKITDDNYALLIIKLVELCSNITVLDDIKEILTSISNRTLFIELSAKIYKELINNNALFLDAANTDFAALKDTIKSVSSLASTQTSYENLCKNNKKLDYIKNKVTFYTILTTYNLDTITCIGLEKLIQEMINDMDHFVNIEIIYNIISIKIGELKQKDQWNDIVERLNMIKLKKEPYENVTNKVLFKTMDILDIIEKQM